MDVREQASYGEEMGQARQTQEEIKKSEEAFEWAWRMSEWTIEGFFCGCEFPRLWPPSRGSQ